MRPSSASARSGRRGTAHRDSRAHRRNSRAKAWKFTSPSLIAKLTLPRCRHATPLTELQAVRIALEAQMDATVDEQHRSGLRASRRQSRAGARIRRAQHVPRGLRPQTANAPFGCRKKLHATGAGWVAPVPDASRPSARAAPGLRRRCRHWSRKLGRRQPRWRSCSTKRESVPLRHAPSAGSPIFSASGSRTRSSSTAV